VDQSSCSNDKCFCRSKHWREIPGQDENGNVYAAIANEALYDNNKAQLESLLFIHQALADPQNGIDDCAHCEHDIDGKPG
jgi:hypothetical protein